MSTVTDPRTEQVLAAADDVECLVCSECWTPGQPMLCGAPCYGVALAPDSAQPTCPLCVEAWPVHDRMHERADRPWWKRWLP
jgi:hypothetical protein